jgi:hypothetical protein
MKALKYNKDMKVLTFSWVILLLLTLTAAILSLLNISSNGLVFLALSITVIKSQFVVDIFMGLKKVDYRWRYLMLSYIAIIPLIMGSIYFTAANG